LGRSLIPGIVKGTGKDLLVAGLFLGGGILALGYANKHFGILNKLVSGAATVGSSLGQAVGGGLGSIPSGVGQGFLSVFSPTGDQNGAIRNALGLPVDTNGCLTIPFTNIPFPGQNCSALNKSTIPPTGSGAQDPSKQATSNGAVGITVDTSRLNQRSQSTNPSAPGSNLVNASDLGYAANILSGIVKPANLSVAPGLRSALNQVISSLGTAQTSLLVGQPTVGNYVVPSGDVVPLTQAAVDYYNKIGVRVPRV
jgi:hypothetical protein